VAKTHEIVVGLHSGLKPCAVCDIGTARVGNDGRPRHGWCEKPKTWPWDHNAPRPKRTEIPAGTIRPGPGYRGLTVDDVDEWSPRDELQAALDRLKGDADAA